MKGNFPGRDREISVELVPALGAEAGARERAVSPGQARASADTPFLSLLFSIIQCVIIDIGNVDKR